MKLPLFTTLIPLLGATVFAEPMQDRITAVELTSRQQAAGFPLAAMRPADDTPTNNTRRPTEEGLIAGSVILSDGENWTLVPRGAVIYLPEQHRAKVGVCPVGNLLSWCEFSTINRAWIGAEKVTLRQAEGVHPFDERRIAFWPKQERVMVATYLDGPISVVTPTAALETASNR